MSEKSINQLVQDCINKKLTDGTLEKLVDEKIESALGKVIEDTLSWNGDTYKLIKSKTAEIMGKAIEYSSFTDHTTKLAEVLDKAFENSSVQHYGIICKNIKELLDNSGTEFGEVVNLDTIIEKYEKFLEEFFQDKKYLFHSCDIDDDGDSPYGTTEISYTVKIIKRHTSLEIFDVVLAVESDDENLTRDTTITFTIKERSYDKGKHIIDLHTDWRISELRNLNEMLIYLLKLKQSYTTISLEPNFNFIMSTVLSDTYEETEDLTIEFSED